MLLNFCCAKSFFFNSEKQMANIYFFYFIKQKKQTIMLFLKFKRNILRVYVGKSKLANQNIQYHNYGNYILNNVSSNSR
jgi:hypothetical protein